MPGWILGVAVCVYCLYCVLHICKSHSWESPREIFYDSHTNIKQQSVNAYICSIQNYSYIFYHTTHVQGLKKHETRTINLLTRSRVALITVYDTKVSVPHSWCTI